MNNIELEIKTNQDSEFIKTFISNVLEIVKRQTKYYDKITIRASNETETFTKTCLK